MTKPAETSKSTWQDYINVEQLPEDYQLLVQTIGLEMTIKLAYQFPKVQFYFKSPESLFLSAKEKYIRENFTGNNHRRLALDTSLSERHVYDVINEERKNARPGWKQDSLI